MLINIKLSNLDRDTIRQLELIALKTDGYFCNKVNIFPCGWDIIQDFSYNKKFELIIHQGGPRNRNIPPLGKQLFKKEIFPKDFYKTEDIINNIKED